MARLIEFTRDAKIACGAIMLWNEEQSMLGYFDAELFCKTFNLYGIVKQPVLLQEDNDGERLPGGPGSIQDDGSD